MREFDVSRIDVLGVIPALNRARTVGLTAVRAFTEPFDRGKYPYKMPAAIGRPVAQFQKGAAEISKASFIYVIAH